MPPRRKNHFPNCPKSLPTEIKRTVMHLLQDSFSNACRNRPAPVSFLWLGSGLFLSLGSCICHVRHFLQGEHKIFYSVVWKKKQTKKELVLAALVRFPSLRSKASIGMKTLEITFFFLILANYIITPQMVLCQVVWLTDGMVYLFTLRKPSSFQKLVSQKYLNYWLAVIYA